ncbi:MAG: hypothetical protein ACI80V_003740 [Rhodothermales bacterium]|jgi:hypothetical protein
MRRSGIRYPNSTKSAEFPARKWNAGGNSTFAPLLRVTEVELGERILLRPTLKCQTERRTTLVLIPKLLTARPEKR